MDLTIFKTEKSIKTTTCFFEVNGETKTFFYNGFKIITLSKDSVCFHEKRKDLVESFLKKFSNEVRSLI